MADKPDAGADDVALVPYDEGYVVAAGAEETKAPADGAAGPRGHWGYGGDGPVEDMGYHVGGEDEDGGGVDDDDDDDEEEDLEFELPPFASEGNVQLNEEIKAMQRDALEAEVKFKEDDGRVKIMREHTKNVKLETVHTEKLQESKNKEIKTEDHLKQLAEREVGRIRQEIRKLDVSADEVQDQLNVVQNAIFKGGEKLEQFKVSMNFNQEQLEQWAMAARQKEEDNEALVEYTRADEAKIKELRLGLEKLQTAVNEQKLALEREVTETQAKQIELEKTAEEYRVLHAERQDLVRQWREAIEAMQRRDEEIAAAAEHFMEEKARIKVKQEALEQAAQQLKQLEAENVAFERKIATQAGIVGKQRQEYIQAQAKLAEFKDEVEVLRAELQKAASDLVTSRAKSSNLAQQAEEKQRLLEVARERYHASKRKLESASRDADKVEAVATRREEELKEVEADVVKAERDLEALKEVVFKSSQQLFKLRQEESNMIAEISGAQAASKNLSAKIHKLDQERMRQQELVYNAEFAIQQMERKVARASGERSDEEKKQLQARIAALTTELDNATAQEKTLAQQAKRLQDDLKRSKRQQAQLEQKLEGLQSRAKEMELQNKSTEQTLKKAMAEKEDVMVEHDVLKLEVRKLRNILSGRADEVFGLENRKAQLEMSMEERKREIAVHMDVQRQQAKLAEAERHRVAMDLKERVAKVGVLKSKYDTICGRMKSEDGEERSQAYFVIKAAQRREELQREGDELDANIRKCEVETKALVRTLKSLAASNSEYRVSNHKADMGSADAASLRKLETQSKAAADLLFRRKRDLQRLAGEVEDERERLQQLDEQVLRTQDTIDQLRTSRAAAEAEEAEQRALVREAEEKLAEVVHHHRASRGTTERTPDEVAFQAAAVTDTNNNVLFTLGQLAKEFPELQPTLQAELKARGLTLPPRPPSRAPTAM